MRRLTDAEIIEGAYGGTSPIKIPCARHARMLWAHSEFRPLAEPEVSFNRDMQPATPGLLGYLKGTPVYFKPVRRL